MSILIRFVGIILGWSILIGSGVANAQTIAGQVLDAETQAPIELADVYLMDLGTGVTTDSIGFFRLEHLPHQPIHLQISYVGYKTLEEVIPEWPEGGARVFYLEPSHFDLKEVVVAAPMGRLQRDNIVSIAQRKVEDLRQARPLTLAQALTNIPGVDQNSTGEGIGKPVIRGLSGNRIVTYANGVRVENQQWGDEHGLGVGEVGVERVEVIKGPASLLYGSDALGGVLYFVDERYAKHNSVEGFVASDVVSNTWGSINKFGLKYHRGAMKYNLFGGWNAHADFQVPNGQRVYNSRFDEHNIKTAIGYNRGPWITDVRYSFLQNHFGIVEEAQYGTSTERSRALPFQTIVDHNLSWANTVWLGTSKLEMTIGTASNYRQEFEEDASEAALGMKLRTSTSNLKWHSPVLVKHLDLVVGMQGMHQTNRNTGEEQLIPDARTRDLGGFTVLNATFGRWQMQAGIRADKRNIRTEALSSSGPSTPSYTGQFSGVTYSTGAVYSAHRNKVRLNLSSGFRSPTTSELLSDGVHEGTVRYEMGSSSLGAERATQIDGSWAMQLEHLHFSVDPFYNFIENYIHLIPTPEIKENFPVFQYVQSQAVLYGGEVAVHYHPHHLHWLHVESSYSVVRAEDASGTPLPLIPQGKFNTTLAAEVNTPGRIRLKNIFLQHIYKVRQDRIGLFESPTPSYSLFNVGWMAETRVRGVHVECSGGINNIRNVRYVDHLSRYKNLDISAPGRSFYLGVKLNLSHTTRG